MELSIIKFLEKCWSCLKGEEGFSFEQKDSSRILHTGDKIFIWTEDTIEEPTWVHEIKKAYRFNPVYWYLDEKDEVACKMLQAESKMEPCRVPEMTCSLEKVLPPEPNEDITVETIDDLEKIKKWADVSSAGRNPEQAKQAYLFGKPLFDQLAPDNVVFVIGYYKNQPVATSLAILDGDAVGLFFVNTNMEYRRLGLAHNVSYAALKKAQELGAKTAILTSTPMAEALYLKMGFQPKRIFLEYNLSSYIRQI